MNITRGRSASSTPHARGWLLTLAFGMVWHALPMAAAQSTPNTKPPADYQTLIDRGLAAYNRQHPAEARAWFARAHALQPGARTLRALGIADLALDNYSLAKGELEAALAERSLPLTDEQRREVDELLGWMRGNLGTLQLRCTPLHAEAKIDGRAVTQHDVLLAPEEHRLIVSARGFVPEERTFTVSMDKPLRLDIVLERAAQPAARGAELAPSVLHISEQPTDTAPKLWPWLGGAGAVLLATGATLFAFGLSDKAKVEHATGPVRLSALQSAHDRVPWLTGVGLSLGVVGLAGVGSAAVLLLTQRPAHPDVAWSFEPGLAYTSLTRRF